jgi:hypothetical protein
MALAIKNEIEKFKEKVKNVVLKIALRIPLNSYRFLFILVFITLWNIYS